MRNTHLLDARDWLADCEFTDLEDPWELTDAEVRAGIDRHYDGGWAAFTASDVDHREGIGDLPVSARLAHLLTAMSTVLCLIVFVATGGIHQ